MRAKFDRLALADSKTPGSAANAVPLDLSRVDLSHDVEITPSASGPRALIAAGFAMTFLSSSFAFGWWGEVGEPETMVGLAGVALFGIATCRLIWMLPAQRGPVVIIGPYGIRDQRIGNEFLLWESITEVSTSERRGRRAVVLKLTPALQRQRACTVGRGSGTKNADHIVVSAEGLATSFDTLLNACRTFHAASVQHSAMQHKVS